MELTIRDWMVVIGAGLILAVLVDAARRVYRERRSEVRLNARISRRDEPSEEDEAFNLLSELPNGGARIVTRDDLAPPNAEASLGQPTPISRENSHGGDGGGLQAHTPDQSIEADDAIADDPDAARVTGPANASASVASAMAPDARSTPKEDFDIPSFSALDGDDVLDGAPQSARQASSKKVGRGSGPVEESPETLDWLEQLKEPEPEVEPEARLPRDINPHVFVLNVTARNELGFAGKDIMHILLACDLRFGDMDFFHRHEQSAGRGPIQFSVCNMMKPGVFDIDNMESLHTRGLMFFVTLPGPEDMLKAFDYMYETAKTVAKNLDGDVLDETRSAVTRQSLEHMRQQIRELERRIAMDMRR